MEIPQGYKWTELGVIPEEWEVKQISEFTSIVTGGTPNSDWKFQSFGLMDRHK